MSQFEFSTKEEREAWRVFRPLYEKLFNGGGRIMLDLDEAASRFDEREKTCGIEPLSGAHHFLGSLCTYPSTVKSVGWRGENVWGMCEKDDLAEWKDGWWEITDRGREVLSTLNAMCKVSK